MSYLDEILPREEQDVDPGDDTKKATDPEVAQGDLNTVAMTDKNLTKDIPILPLHPEGNHQEQSLHLHLPVQGTLLTLYTRDLLCQEEVHHQVGQFTFDNPTDKMHIMLDIREETATPMMANRDRQREEHTPIPKAIEKGLDLSQKDPELEDYIEIKNSLSLRRIQ